LVACGEVTAAPDAAAPALPEPPAATVDAVSDVTVAPVVSVSPAHIDTTEVESDRPLFEAPVEAATVRIESGPLRVGSRPGDVQRRPQVEADLIPVDVPGFDIDALPYPNDPAQPAQLVGTRNEATQLCEARGRRLCHELEWERACRGDTSDPYPGGSSLDLAACVNDPAACASVVGVFDLGIRAPEWTSDDADERLASLERTAVARGGRASHSLAAHRCGTRHAVNPAGGGRALAFRCCGGESPDLTYPDVGLRRMFRDLDFDTARWRELLATVPELARFASNFTAFDEVAATRALTRGGATAESVPWDLAPGPFAWSPTPGEEVWIVAGRSGEVSLLAAIYPNPDGTVHHAASFVFAEEEAPIAVMHTRAERGELQWTTCWSCGGENGTVAFTEAARIVIAQR